MTAWAAAAHQVIMSRFSPGRWIVAILALAVAYWGFYQVGAPQSLAAALGQSDPGPLVLPTELAQLSGHTGEPNAGHDAKTTLGVLNGLVVAGQAPMSGYARDKFGPEWADVDGNGCDTRNDILARDLTAVTFEPGAPECVVATGTLHDPYTGATVDFTRGQQTSTAVQVDHVVPLGDAWATGAQTMTASQRESFANDPLNLLAVDGPTNAAKGDSDAAQWLPPNQAFTCTYATIQVEVKAKYRLWVTPAEKAALSDVLAAC